MSRLKVLLVPVAMVAITGAIALSDEINNYALAEESSYQPPQSWEESKARIRTLVSEGYNICSVGGLDYLDLDLKKESCFDFKEADQLRYAGISPKEANPLAGLPLDMVKLRNEGCNLTKLPEILKQSKQATGDTHTNGNTYETLYLAESVCQGKRKIQDFYKYGPRFRGQDDFGTPLIKELDEVGITTPTEAECYSLALSGPEVVEFGRAGVSCKQERAYADLVAQRKLTLKVLYSQRQNDCFDVLGAIKQGISPETAEWYFQLGDHNPELSLNYCDMAALEKRVAGKKTTRKEIADFAVEENERLRQERAKVLLR